MRSTILFTSLLLAATATANAGGIVLESYTQAPPPNASDYTTTMINVMAKSGFEAGAAVGRKFESDVSRPGVVKQGLPLDYDKQLNAAISIAGSGQYHQAVVALTPLLELAHANPAAFVNHGPWLQLVDKAIVLLAVSQNGDGDHNAAIDTLSEVMRSFPSERVSASFYGQAPNQLFLTAQAQVRGRGRLIVTSENPNGVIWVDEAFAAVHTATRENLVPGEYRVFVQTGTSVSRVHLVNVVANQDTSLTIDGDFDADVETTTYAGLRFRSDDDRDKKEPDDAAKFGNAINADQIVVIGIEKIQGVESVTGTLISKTGGKRLRKGAVPLPSASPEQLKQLALYVIGQGTAGGRINVIDESTREVAHPTKSTGTQVGGEIHVDRGTGDAPRSHAWKWLAAVGGAAAIGGSIYGIATDGNCIGAPLANGMCKNYYQNLWWGIPLGAVGVGLAVTSIYLFKTAKTAEAPQRSAFIVPTHGGAMVGYSLRF